MDFCRVDIPTWRYFARITNHDTGFKQWMFILYLFLILPSFLFLASLVVVGFGEYFVDFLLELGMVVVAFDRLPILEVKDVDGW